jgi:hypothetical protein
LQGTTTKNFLGKAFIIFESSKDRDDILKKYDLSYWDILIKLSHCYKMSDLYLTFGEKTLDLKIA